MKEIIFIHEPVFLEGNIPVDLLDPERFEIRSVSTPVEIIVLSEVEAPKALVLDLRIDWTDVETIQNQITQRMGRPIAILGILPDTTSFSKFFECGISALLKRPFTASQLREELQILLGISFRRFERLHQRAFGRCRDGRFYEDLSGTES